MILIALTMILIDFTKTFDLVNHNVLKSINFSDTAVKLINRYLTERAHNVEKFMSSFLPVRTGVPKGSVLDSLLFSLNSNDLPIIFVHSKLHMFADGVQLTISCDI